MIDLSKKFEHYRRRFRDAQKSRGLTNDELAERMGAHPGTIGKLRGGRISLDDEWRARSAQAFGIEEDVLFGDGPLPEPRPDEIFRPKRRGPKPKAVANDNVELPVYGMAAGSLRGHYVVTSDIIDTVPCPPGLEGVEGAYVLIVKGTSMVPRYMPDEFLYINPHQRVVAGDHVVIELQSYENAGTETFVKRYDTTDGEEIVVTQYNPESRLRFRRQFVRHMHRVLPINELYMRR